MVSISQILLASGKVTLETSPQTKNRMPVLKEGEVIRARVLRSMTSRQALIEIAGKSLLAKTFTPLKAGESVLFKVLQTHPEYVLKTIESEGEIAGEKIKALIQSIGRTNPFRHLERLVSHSSQLGLVDDNEIGPIRQLFERIALKSGKADPQLLKDIIQHSGLSWEKKLSLVVSMDPKMVKAYLQKIFQADLKAQTLNYLLQHNAAPDEVTNHAKNFLEGLEKFQFVNRLGSDETAKFLFPIPVLFDDTFRFGQLLIQLGHGKNKEQDWKNKLIRVVFLLEMTNLGDIQADFTLLGLKIGGQFAVSNQEARQDILGHIPKLVKNLEKQGFMVSEISCDLVAPETLASATLVDQLVDEHDGLFSLII
jgi:flagellar hook-length control protein FliK